MKQKPQIYSPSRSFKEFCSLFFINNLFETHYANMNTNSKLNNYTEIHTKWSGLQDPQSPWYSDLSNAAALLYQMLTPWWVGFYLVEGDYLHLGPFQGPTACTQILKGKGVCGTAWLNKQPIIVPNVHVFPGHIACSDQSNSEIVIPLISNGQIWGVLDIDSIQYDAFDTVDVLELEKFCASLRHHKS